MTVIIERESPVTEVTDSTSGPLQALESQSENPSLRFPLDVEEIDHWAAFRVYKNRQNTREDTIKSDLRADITLPVPSNLEVTYQSNWENAELGVIGEAVSRNVGAVDLNNPFSSGLDAATGTMGSIGQEGLMSIGLQAAQSDVASLVGTAAGGVIGKVPGVKVLGAGASGGATAGVQGAIVGALYGKGIARNPHIALLFQGVGFRTHNFQYKFTPRSEAESLQLKLIIAAFKYYSAPGYTGSKGHFFKYPEAFDIDFHHEEHLFSIGQCNLTSFNVGYHGEGTPLYFQDTKAPVSVTLSLGFTETKIVTKNEIKKYGR